MESLSALAWLARQRPRQQDLSDLRGLLASILTEQQPSQNVEVRGYPTGVAFLNAEMKGGPPPSWPSRQKRQPRRFDVMGDVPASPLPMSVQMRAAPFLDEMGALLEKPWAP